MYRTKFWVDHVVSHHKATNLLKVIYQVGFLINKESMQAGGREIGTVGEAY